MTVINLGWKFECDWHDLGIGEWYGAEVIRKYLDMCGIGVLDDFTRMDFYWRGNIAWKWMKEHTQESVVYLVRVY